MEIFSRESGKTAIGITAPARNEIVLSVKRRMAQDTTITKEISPHHIKRAVQKMCPATINGKAFITRIIFIFLEIIGQNNIEIGTALNEIWPHIFPSDLM